MTRPRSRRVVLTAIVFAAWVSNQTFAQLPWWRGGAFTSAIPRTQVHNVRNVSNVRNASPFFLVFG